ncbi:DUF1566 domain-containing protein [bacterium]|nr:DUF1566 domain-containing protein [bacterium]
MNELKDIQNEIATTEKKSDLGKKTLKILKFISLTIIKMAVVILTIASISIALFGILISIISAISANDHRKEANKIRSKGWITKEDADDIRYHDSSADTDVLVGSITGVLSSGCFFLTKALHGILREYLWPALGGLAICIAIIVIVEPNFYIDGLNYVHQEILKDGQVVHRRNESNTNTKQQATKPAIARHQDNSTGLIWSDRTTDKVNWFQAKEYCSNLEDSAWRLPTIDELRTLILNCPGSQTNGLCLVSEAKQQLSSDNWSKDCFCKQTKNINYSKFGDKNRLWASSEQINNTENAWYVFFSNANIGSDSKRNDYYARCVLKDSQKNETVASRTSKEQKTAATSKNIINGLQWSNKSAKKITWEEVYSEGDYCSTLKEGGYNDWRVPNFNEIRTLITNCPNMESKGICKFKSVSPNCERYCDDECNGSESCFDKCTARDCSPLVNCSPCKKGDHSRFGDKEALWFFGDSNGEGDFRNATTLDFTNGEISMSGVYLAKTKNSEFVV